MIIYMYQIGDNEVVVSSELMSLVVVLGNLIEISSQNYHNLETDGTLHFFW